MERECYVPIVGWSRTTAAADPTELVGCARTLAAADIAWGVWRRDRGRVCLCAPVWNTAPTDRHGVCTGAGEPGGAEERGRDGGAG